MLCLSCIVVFCTAYVLILPAITLEKKTTCEEEEQIAIQEEQTPIQEANENTVQSTIPSDDSEDIEFVSCEPIEEEIDDVDNVEITEDPEEEMDVDFASGEEDAIAAAADETVTPEAGTTDGFDLSAENNKDRLSDVKLFYKLPDNENWQEFSTADNAALIPATAKIKLQVEYKDIQIQNLINNYKCKLTYNLPKNPELLRNVTTEGAIFDRNNARVGTVTSESGKIIVTFDEIIPRVKELLVMIQNDMFERAKTRRDSMIYDAKTYDELKEIATTKDGGFTKINWCGDVACENKIKDDFGIKSRCLIEDEEVTGPCTVCGRKAKTRLYIGRQY